jgi:hypothetical protein
MIDKLKYYIYYLIESESHNKIKQKIDEIALKIKDTY